MSAYKHIKSMLSRQLFHRPMIAMMHRPMGSIVDSRHSIKLSPFYCYDSYYHHLRCNMSSSSSSSIAPGRMESTQHVPTIATTTTNNSSVPTSTTNPTPDFSTNARAFRNKTTMELIRAAMIFGVCSKVPSLVQHAESILYYSYRIFGATITNHIVRVSFYNHFCAGSDVASMEPTIQQLQNDGIGCIFDFAAEHDHTKDDTTGIHDDPELQYDQNSEFFQQSIRLAALLVPLPTAIGSCISTDPNSSNNTTTTTTCIIGSNHNNCVAVKVTGLVDASLLTRTALVANALRQRVVPSNDGDIFDIILNARAGAVLDKEDLGTTLSAEDLVALQRLHDRCLRMSETAKACGIRLLFDAEQVRYQPAIDALVLHLQRVYNSVTSSDYPIIYNTYQCYLKDSTQRLQFDLETSKLYQYHMGIKLVRGAYMESERSVAKKAGRPSAIHDTLNDTHKSFNAAIHIALQHAAQLQHRGNENDTRSIEVMCATHNQTSIEYAIRIMNELNIDRSSKCMSFAQLFGMKDNLTFNLGLHGYSAYKYVPYGDVTMVTPYLLRRAMENSAIRGGADDEWQMVVRELRRRAHF